MALVLYRALTPSRAGFAT